VLTAATGGFGAGGVERPVVLPAAEGWTAWYAGIDAGQGRPGRARGADAERFHRELHLPTGADTVGFRAVPARDEDAISLDVTVDGSTLSGWGCSALARDADRGFLYVGCKLRPWVYVLDVRDDGLPGAPDLNYLDVEAILLLETTTNGIGSGTGVGSGVRGLLVDPVRGWLWGTSDEPEALYAIDTSGIVDDDGVDIVREPSLTMLPLPRSGGRDEGVRTQALVGPAALAMHPDGRHLLVSNFNNNSVSAFDLTLGAAGTLVAESRDLGENPYALSVSPDGRWLAVGNYLGEVDDRTTSSTLSVLDADPSSPTFLQVVTTVGNK
jgi:DNA-binding beta-propeller fold protein YncE